MEVPRSSTEPSRRPDGSFQAISYRHSMSAVKARIRRYLSNLNGRLPSKRDDSGQSASSNKAATR